MPPYFMKNHSIKYSRLIFTVIFFICSQLTSAIDFKEYRDLDIPTLIGMMKTTAEEGPGLNLYNMAPHRTPFKMVAFPRKMNGYDLSRLMQDTSFSPIDKTFLDSYGYILELRIPSQEPSLSPDGVLRIYFQEVQYPFIIKEVALDDIIMLFYRFYSISTATQEINLFAMDFWRAKK